MSLNGKVSFVTGGSRGIGEAIAHTLLEKGARVAVGFCSSQGSWSSNSHGPDVLCVQVDIEKRQAIREAIGTIEETWGNVDILVNNAAIAQEKPFSHISDEDWDHMFAVNLRGVFALSQEVLPSMVQRGWGRIINLASIGGQWGGLNQVHYAAAKAGVISLTRSLSRMYTGKGITANAVSPGLVKTDMAMRELDSQEGREKVAAIPIGRPATTKEVADVVGFLATDEAAYISGQTISVNGGMYFG